jgi:F420H(2)-dependent quinone reductase
MNRWRLLTPLVRMNVIGYRLSGGRFGHRAPGLPPMLVLDHVGAKSGTQRATVLAYLEDGDNLVIVASKGGWPQHPAWFHNLKANPDIELWAGGRGGAYRAREAEGEERARIWKLATELYPGYDDYQRKADAAGRRIPVVVCEPRDAESS